MPFFLSEYQDKRFLQPDSCLNKLSYLGSKAGLLEEVKLELKAGELSSIALVLGAPYKVVVW